MKQRGSVGQLPLQQIEDRIDPYVLRLVRVPDTAVNAWNMSAAVDSVITKGVILGGRLSLGGTPSAHNAEIQRKAAQIPHAVSIQSRWAMLRDAG